MCVCIHAGGCVLRTPQSLSLTPACSSAPVCASVCIVRTYPGRPVCVIFVLLLFSCPALLLNPGSNIPAHQGGGGMCPPLSPPVTLPSTLRTSVARLTPTETILFLRKVLHYDLMKPALETELMSKTSSTSSWDRMGFYCDYTRFYPDQFLLN